MAKSRRRPSIGVMMDSGTKRLQKYLTDHLALSRAGIELIQRCLEKNDEGELGSFLRMLLGEARSERQTLENILRELGGSPSILKETATWVLEKASGLKTHGLIFGYSDLDRLTELEAMLVGVRGKLDMWRILDQERKHLAKYSLKSIVEQVERQVGLLQRHCLAVAAQAFAPREETQIERPISQAIRKVASRAASRR